MALHADDQNSETDDLSYQTCYVFKPTIEGDHDIDDRPRKKRKSGRSKEPPAEAPASTQTWPKLCAGAETDTFPQLRELSYAAHWRAVDDEVESVADDFDEPSIEKIRTYIQTEDESDQQLRTAVVVSGPDKNAFVQCLGMLLGPFDKDRIVPLDASQAPSLQAALKALIRNVIGGVGEYDSFIAANKRQIPMNFDLELLRKYLEDKDISRIIIALPDAETFDLNVFSELIANLASWRDRIPFVLMLGLATTVQLFESRLSKATLRLLNAEAFSLSSERDVFFDIFAAAQTDRESWETGVEKLELSPRLGPSVVASLAALADEQYTTTHMFTKAIHYAYMTHFYSNSLSNLLGPDLVDDTNPDPALCESIRNTLSFQSRCTDILDGTVPDEDASTVRAILSSDTELINYTQRQLEKSSATLHHATSSLIALTRIASHLSPETSALRTYHELLTSSNRDTIQESESYSLITTSLPSLSPASLTALLPKITSFIPAAGIKTPEDLLQLVHDFTSTLGPAKTTPFLAEALIINARGPLYSAFNPKPRFAIERALSCPSDYLGCECCISNQVAGRGKEPSAILYSLLGEAGREINVMDLWTTFRDRVTSDDTTAGGPTTKTAKGKGKATPAKTTSKPKPATEPSGAKRTPKGKTAATPAADATEATTAEGGGDAERQALALFHRALAELRYLGLVKSTSDRRLNKGVEVISRTTWHGL